MHGVKLNEIRPESYNTILVKKSAGTVTVTFDRLSRRNSINDELLRELHTVLNQAEADPTCRIIILAGQKGVFCTGMDFEAYTSDQDQVKQDARNRSTSLYMETIQRLSLIPKVIISNVDGVVMAGGIGLVAASDLVVATPQSQFSLSEVLWGLLPAMVTPYLIRRIGFQKAYSMTLTTIPVSAREALNINLVDEVSASPEEIIRQLTHRLMRLEEVTIKNLKAYFRKMWIITEQMEETAVAEAFSLSSQPNVRENIENYVKYKRFPWEK